MDPQEGRTETFVLYGINFFAWERQRWLEGKETFSQTLNRILAMAWSIIKHWREGVEPVQREIKILRRAQQIRRAVGENWTVRAVCSEPLLRALGIYKEEFFDEKSG